MEQYFAVPKLRMHHNYWHRQSNALADTQEIGDLYFPFIKAIFKLVQLTPIGPFRCDRVKLSVYSTLYDSWSNMSTSIPHGEREHHIHNLTTCAKQARGMSLIPCGLSSGSLVSKSSSWIAQGLPCHAAMYLSSTKAPHHIKRRICISTVDMFRKQFVFFHTDGSR